MAMNKCRVIHINANEQTVGETTIEKAEDCRRLVGSAWGRAGNLPNGDLLFISSLATPETVDFFFVLKSIGPMPFAGNGFVIGKLDEFGMPTPAISTVQEIRDNVQIKRKTVME